MGLSYNDHSISATMSGRQESYTGELLVIGNPFSFMADSNIVVLDNTVLYAMPR